MGSGIAQVFAMHNFRVMLYDLSNAVLQKATDAIRANLEYLHTRSKISAEERDAIISRITACNDIRDCHADLVIEAVVEDAAVKIKLINELFAVNSNNTVIVTNTSSLSVNKIGSAVNTPQRFAGMHFFNPATMMNLVEIVKTPSVDEKVIDMLRHLSFAIGKTPVVCNDSPGFIVNRVARPYYLEALYIAEQHHTPAHVIDRLMESCGFKMGPFRLMDLIGNDVNYSVSTIVYEALNKPARLRPSNIQKEMVNNGLLGRKTGKGFYEY
jgi:3-hydroxybutyryl-CoA dehydrogenase